MAGSSVAVLAGAGPASSRGTSSPDARCGSAGQAADPVDDVDDEVEPVDIAAEELIPGR
jgi:hypothetical protein